MALHDCHARLAVSIWIAIPLAMFPSCARETADRPPGPPRQRTGSIQRTAIRSSVIPTAGYDPDRRILELELHNGAVYQYFDVPRSVHRELITADAPGRFFNANIRRGGYKYRQLVPSPRE
ncbi:MAG: KTSC domain-containing protein [Planctomycetota bacterium]|nr:KTSC domain-containing protein [Planctomycetota bacterium]